LRKSRRGVSKRETAQICSAIAELKPKRIAFSGGEPTLYIKKINGILRAVDAFADVRIITNGHFAKDAVSALKTIRAFHRLDAVQMSYDKFHKTFSSLSRVRELFNACKKADLGFSVVVSVSSPLDMIVLKELRGVGGF
jgi:molybdenum cofactor biosynthesis enzyme MoaA